MPTVLTLEVGFPFQFCEFSGLSCTAMSHLKTCAGNVTFNYLKRKWCKLILPFDDNCNSKTFF